MRFALVGNQNCGKTTLFNVLTGSNQHVGNFPGVTVDQKIGKIVKCENADIVDLPGIYSIRPYSNEEIVTRDFVINEKPDGIINIVDATNIERNLYLTSQLLELRIPMVIALNMMDEVRENGGSIDIVKIAASLGVPVVPISAYKEEGIDELISQAINVVKKRITPKVYDFCQPGPIHRCIHSLSHIVEDHADAIGISPRFCVSQVLMKDDKFIKLMDLDQNELELIEHTIIEMENETGMDVDAAIASMRYDFIETVCKDTVKKPSTSKEKLLSERIDKYLTNRFLAIPIFLFVMFLVFYLTFGLIGGGLSSIFETFTIKIIDLVDIALTNYGINPIVHSLIVDGILAGVGSILSFLPNIVILFLCLSILEDTGYMARIAFVMDKLLRKIGLSGKSIVPLLIGFGCTVPAVMASRTLSSERDRKMTILLTPFMSCNAKIAIYSVFASAFFKGYEVVVMITLYFGGIVLGILVALLFKKTIFKGKPIPFVMELPNYRLPSIKSVALLLWEKIKDFVSKAFSVILVATVVIWFLESFDTRINYCSNPKDSLLGGLGQLLVPILSPLGFTDWRIGPALITGISAKEAVVSTLAVIMGVSESGLQNALNSIFTTASAASFLTFSLLYTPCIAAIATIKKELKSTFQTIIVVIFQCGFAWLVSFIVYQIGVLL